MLLLFQAYKLGLYGPKIVWLLPGWYSDFFWREHNHEVDCTVEEMEQAAEGVFLVVSVYFNPVEERGVANLTGMLLLKLDQAAVVKVTFSLFQFYKITKRTFLD